MKTRLLLRGLVIGFFSLLMIGCDNTPTPVGKEFKLVFLSNRESGKGRFDIFSMNVDGSRPENLTHNAYPVRSISAPLLSPDQKEVLFTCFDAQGTTLKLLDLQTGAVRHLARVDHDLPQARFSPKGDLILFIKKVVGRRQIHLIHRDGSGEKNLSNNAFEEFEADFSSDASQIVYISRRTTPATVWLMDVEGRQARQIVANAGECRHPHFSPDGKAVVFQSIVKNDNDIYVARIGGLAEWLFKSGFNETFPFYVSHGRKVVFLSNLRGMQYLDILAADVKTKKTVLLTDGLNVINQNPCVSGNGKKIVFESITFDNSEIYLVDVDEKKPINLTHHPGWDCSPAF